MSDEAVRASRTYSSKKRTVADWLRARPPSDDASESALDGDRIASRKLASTSCRVLGSATSRREASASRRYTRGNPYARAALYAFHTVKFFSRNGSASTPARQRVGQTPSCTGKLEFAGGAWRAGEFVRKAKAWLVNEPMWIDRECGRGGGTIARGTEALRAPLIGPESAVDAPRVMEVIPGDDG